jgi:hypothetical protein
MTLLAPVPVWKCRDGRRLPVPTMETSHIERTLAMLKRKGYVSPGEFCNMVSYTPQGDNAFDAWEAEITNAKITSFLDIFAKELQTRTNRAVRMKHTILSARM